VRILIWGPAPWSNTGYGVYCRNLATTLAKEGHDTAIFAFTGLSGRVQWGDITVFGNPFNNSQHWVREVARRWKADITLQVFDAWTLHGSLHRFLPPRMVLHTPIDSEPLAEWFVEAARQAAAVVPQSFYGKNVYEQAGILTEDPIYNGIDPNDYRPHPKAKARRKFKMGSGRMPKDAFVALIVGTNKGDRKNLPNQLMAFAEFARRHEDAYLIAWTYPFFDQVNPEGYMLPDIWARCNGPEGRFIYPDMEQYHWGMDDSEMALLYSSADVLMECSLGEGFGRPIIEAMACRTPVIGSNNTAITELVQGRGWLVPCSVPYWQQFLSSRQSYPDNDAILEALEDAYTDTQKRLGFADAGVSFSMGLHYDTLISERWLPLLRRVAGAQVDFSK